MTKIGKYEIDDAKLAAFLDRMNATMGATPSLERVENLLQIMDLLGGVLPSASDIRGPLGLPVYRDGVVLLADELREVIDELDEPDLSSMITGVEVEVGAVYGADGEKLLTALGIWMMRKMVDVKKDLLAELAREI